MLRPPIRSVQDARRGAGTSRSALVRGTRDWLPADCARLAALERGCSRTASLEPDIEPIRTPILEFTELHERKSGAGIVSKLFELAARRSGRNLPAARADGEHRAGLCRGAASALPCPGGSAARARSSATRRDPGSVRLREFTQAGVELLGRGGPAADAEVIGLADRSLAGRRHGPMRPFGSATSG